MELLAVNFTVFGAEMAALQVRDLEALVGWKGNNDILINDYWNQFEDPNPYVQYLLGTIYIGLMSIALVGNFIVIYVFGTCKSLRTPANMFVVTLALTDFLMMAKTPIFIYNSFHLGPVFGQLGCDIYGALGVYSGLGSAFCNGMISYDRYKVISGSFASSKMTHKKAFLMIMLALLYITPFAILPAMRLWNRFVPEGYLTSCTADFFQHDINGRSYILCIWFFGWFIPICATIFCYYKIYQTVRNNEKQLKEQARKMNVESLRGNQAQADTKAEIKVAKVAFGIIVLFLFSWVPYILVAFIGAFTPKSSKMISPILSMTPAMTIKASACFDPFVYAISHPKYRLEVQRKLPWLCINEPIHENISLSSCKTEVSVTKETKE